MRRFCILLISAGLLQGAAPSHAAPPARLEIAYELSREGSILADIVERLAHGDGKYELLETWKGRGVYAMLGTAKRSVTSRRHSSTLPFDSPRSKPHD